MKTLLHFIALLFLAIMSPFRRLLGGLSGARMAGANQWDPTPHAHGRIAREFVSDLPQNYLLAMVAPGGAADICGPTDAPLGPCEDSVMAGDRATIHHLGSAKGTMTMVASVAIADGDLVYTAVGGKITNVSAAGLWKVGRAVTAANADGEFIEVAGCFPVEV